MLLDRRKNPSNQLPNNLSILSGEQVNLNDYGQFCHIKKLVEVWRSCFFEDTWPKIIK